jgi:hypothetical protein
MNRAVAHTDLLLVCFPFWVRAIVKVGTTGLSEDLRKEPGCLQDGLTDQIPTAMTTLYNEALDQKLRSICIGSWFHAALLIRSEDKMA